MSNQLTAVSAHSRMIWLPHILTAALTLAYCGVVTLGAIFYDLALPLPVTKTLPLYAKIASNPAPWRVAAIVAWMLSLSWGLRRARASNVAALDSQALPMTCLISFLLICIAANLIGMFLPFLSVAYVLK